MTYSTVAVIYNPNSTGPSQVMAEEFAKALKARLPQQKIEVIATEYAGHAEELVYDIASREAHALVVSSSGDGGYNEVVNGAMKAKHKNLEVTTALLPAGNANDHHHSLHDKDIIDLIEKDDARSIDVLKLTSTSGGGEVERYAHSYIGVGISPEVGKELNKTDLNRINELWLAAKTLMTVRPVRLVINGVSKRYDSVVFSNVDKMSKYLKVSQPASVTDGKFEVALSPTRSKWELVTLLFRASTQGVEEDASESTFSFTAIRKTLIQLDGELTTVDAGAEVTIMAEKQALRCFV